MCIYTLRPVSRPVDRIPRRLLLRTDDLDHLLCGINAAYSRNEIVSLANGKEDDPANGWFIGESTNSIYT